MSTAVPLNRERSNRRIQWRRRKRRSHADGRSIKANLQGPKPGQTPRVPGVEDKRKRAKKINRTG